MIIINKIYHARKKYDNPSLGYVEYAGKIFVRHWNDNTAYLSINTIIKKHVYIPKEFISSKEVNKLKYILGIQND